MFLLVGASGLDVTRLLAVVANALALSLGRAVAGDVANLTTVVALLSVGAVAGHVAESAARVASLLTAAVTATETTTVATALGAVARNVSDTTALVAFLATGGTAAVALAGRLGAFPGDVAGGAAAVTRLLLGSYCAFTANMSLATAVVAGRSALLGTVAGLVSGFATVEAATASSLETHFESGEERREMRRRESG